MITGWKCTIKQIKKKRKKVYMKILLSSTIRITIKAILQFVEELFAEEKYSASLFTIAQKKSETIDMYMNERNFIRSCEFFRARDFL